MKFLLASALFTAVLGAPLTDLVERDGNGTVSNLDVGPAFPPAPKPHLNLIFTSETPEPVEISKRNVGLELEARSELTKRSIVIDIWQDTNRGGRHEGLITDINRCYDLGNGWNDAISSLQTPPNYGCYFYVDGGCKGGFLSISKGDSFVFVNTPDWGYNDKISSYLCWT
ncbi:Nn.00g059250.m01.CDS01 [Neocucurbitaria sp. VM-36]